MNKILIVLFVTLISGCALTPKQIKSAKTQDLCDRYAGTQGYRSDMFNPDIKQELETRGAQNCTRSSVVYMKQQAHQNNSNGMQRAGMFMMGINARPRPVTSIIIH